MSCLSYLDEYGSDSEENDTETQKLVLPSPKLDGIIKTPIADKHVDDPTVHGGRARTFPHVRGNWATFVFVKYPKNKSLLNTLQYLSKALESIVDIQQCEDIHISLSKTVVLQYHMISTFTESLKDTIEDFPSFELAFDSIKVYCNEDKSRTFVALKVDHFTRRPFVDLTKEVDTIFREFKLPTFYEKPSFHASLLWTVGDKKNLINKLLKNCNRIETPDSVEVESVHCKIGNRLYQYKLDENGDPEPGRKAT